MIHQVLRRVCSDCGSPKIKWAALGLLVDQLPMSRRKMAMQGLYYFGPGARAWMCRDCNTLGVFA